MPLSNKVELKVQKRSGFDKSHYNLFTSLCGRITPVLLDEVIPNTKINLRMNIAASMPPLAADTFMKTDLAVEAFFVPMRLLSKSFESFFTEQKRTTSDGSGAFFPNVGYLPVASLDLGLSGQNASLDQFFGVRGLPDFMGWRNSSDTVSRVKINPLPFVAYHLVWDHYYRNQDIQSSCFAHIDPVAGADLSSTSKNVAAVIPELFLDSTNYILQSMSDGDNQVAFWNLADGVNLFEGRQRNFDRDYFTNALASPQLGSPMSVNTQSGSFTVASLRAANSLQIFAERNALSGTRFQDTLTQRYNANLSDGVAQRPVLLGACRYNVYTKGHSVNADNAGLEPDNQNPFTVAGGGILGNAYASGSDFIINGFTANEPGYILVNCTLVPTVTYSSGCNRALTRYRGGLGALAEMASPTLQNTGNQPIYQFELNGDIAQSNSNVFGYTDRYADFMDMPDEIHGLFRYGQALDMFVSQRYIARSSNPQISDSFLKIPTDYLNDVLVWSNASSGSSAGVSYGYWAQIGFDYKVSMPLAQYSIPSLQDPAYEHGESVHIYRGGFRF